MIGIEDVVGTFGSDILRGDDGSNKLSGGAFHDELYGFGGDDVLEGGEGRAKGDLGDGGDGNDSCIGIERRILCERWRAR